MTGEENPEAVGGYRPELKRTLGSFQMFAVSFAFISVAVGIFGTYDQVLRTGGPLGIWLWPIVAFGQVLVALVIAQFAARIALTGSSYQWASRLANPRIGWGFGWLTSEEELFVLIDLERVARSLPPFEQMTSSLDVLAQAVVVFATSDLAKQDLRR